jgi:DNA-binding NarL/FixJ family response regulator
MQAHDTNSTVWLVGQHPLVGQHLLHLLNRDPSISVRWISEKIPPASAVGACPLFILDTGSLECPAAEYVRSVKTRIAQSKYVVLDYELDVYKVCRFLSLGVHGFLVYEQVQESLALAVHFIQKGGMWVDSRVLQQYLGFHKGHREAFSCRPEKDSLTLREEEILHLVQQRLSNKEIASILNVTVSTIKFHLSNVFSKLGISSRSDLWRRSAAQIIPMDRKFMPAKEPASAVTIHSKAG